MRPARLLGALTVTAALAAGCAHRPLAVLLSFDVCPATRAPSGGDRDGGGADVVANVSTDVAPGLRGVARDHFPGSCTVELAPGGLPLLACSDPHVDARYVLAWTRPKARALVLERRETPLPGGDASAAGPPPPSIHRAVAEIDIDRAAWIRAAPRSTCGAAP
ncbi:MAG TPA: hypothetical protein VKZ18_27865 [Polyangia bacterium]|nr:hypothetical protein [Polyangia bacterium]